MFKQKEVEKILRMAKRNDSKYELFGASKHQYKLNPPITKEFVHEIQEKYHFWLPEDYVQFITEVGDGGAGPDYGIDPFVEFLKELEDPEGKKYQESYRNSLAKPCKLRPMESDELEDYGFTREGYERNPEKYFVFDGEFDDELDYTNGYFVLGTHGCQWDFGVITAGERRGQIFDTDNENGYILLAHSFSEFYQDWLDYVSDRKRVREKLNLIKMKRLGR